MNKRVLFVAVAISILAGTGIVSQAYAAFTITMETDKDVYDHSSVITVTGQVDPIAEGSEVTFIVQRLNPVGITQIDQISVNSDGSFSTTISTASDMMKYDGTYLINAKYVDVETTVSVELTNAIETSEAAEIGTAVTGITGTAVTGPSGESFYKLGAGQIEYDMTCNATPGFFANADDDSIVIYLDPTDDGIITVTLHEELIKPFEDGTFVVIVNNQEMQDFTQVGNTLTIPCVAGTEKIEIHGSWAIPEFGVIAAMILVVAIVSIIVITAKTRLSLVPRY
ncbi:PEFG-CTERM sorting domain-containing protein [Marine Group I thaumarchaeote]|uniref:PEFG-CTERM sorting domain-containing protein n=1 Tax=Marine Group I thaumarchaeote TaxID=2511932 RepID=A0A7K4NPZ4_9ARCH|nr:PEFG-CTERM sorting domain-containing protein [Marine Group I thaumarchaeote]